MALVEIPSWEDEEQAYRDSLSTVDKAGKRVWLFPKKPSGRLHNWRAVVAALAIGLLVAAPFVTIGGHPLILCNFFDRQFILFGQAFFPQDFYLFALGLITFFVFIIVFTVVYGRIWCGWLCPQTIFMEMVFRKIEYWIEGDAAAQRRLAHAPWTADKIAKRIAKHGLFLIISAAIAHLVMAYLIGWRESLVLMRQSPAANPSGFLALLVFTGIFYAVFAFLREQVCVTICPYGRLQGVLLDKNSAAVAYDHVRGEPRGKVGSTAKGDCIDCKLCVQVCPTGIDIRNGTQLECTNCTACIDACNTVMTKVKRPTGLIRIDSANGIESGKGGFRMTGRVMAYTAVLLLLIGIEVSVFAWRKPFDTTVLRVPGMLYQAQPDGTISNLYNVQLMNKTFDKTRISFRVNHPHAKVELVGKDIILPPAEKAEAVLFITLPPSEIKSVKTELELQVIANGEVVSTTTTNFNGPAQ